MVLPRPPAPFTTAIGTAPGLLVGSAPSSSAHSCSTGVSRPVKSPMSVGSWAGRGMTGPDPGAGSGASGAAGAAAPGEPGSAMVPIAIEPGESGRDRAEPPPSASAARWSAAPVV